MRVNNSEIPKGNPGDFYSPRDKDPIADLLDEIGGEPELTDSSPARRRAEARLDEADLVERVLFELNKGGRFDGVAYRQLFEDLWLYAWPVIKAFLRTGEMGRVLRRYAPHRSVAVNPEDHVVLRNSEEGRDALARDVISRAVKNFQSHALVKRQWSPTKGAALRTWFIGTCALEYPRAYQGWSRSRGTRLDRLAARHEIDPDAVGGQLATHLPDPASIAIDRGDLRAMIEKAQPMTKVILGMLMAGMTHSQIAGELGLTVRAVEGRMYRFRVRVVERQEFLTRATAAFDRVGSGTGRGAL